jgi:hypothetical protein
MEAHDLARRQNAVHLVRTLIRNIYMIATGVGTIDVDQAIASTSLNETLASFVEKSNQPRSVSIIIAG